MNLNFNWTMNSLGRRGIQAGAGDGNRPPSFPWYPIPEGRKAANSSQKYDPPNHKCPCTLLFKLGKTTHIATNSKTDYNVEVSLFFSLNKTTQIKTNSERHLVERDTTALAVKAPLLSQHKFLWTLSSVFMPQAPMCPDFLQSPIP